MMIMHWTEFVFASFALGFTILLAISSVYHYFNIGGEEE